MSDILSLDGLQPYLQGLFPQPQGQIEVRVIVEERGGELVDRRWYDGPTSLLADIGNLNDLASNRGAGVFVGVLPRKDSTSGMVANLLPGHAAWADIDFKDFKEGEEEARERLARFSIPPSLVVRSGHGLHAYWLLQKPTEPGAIAALNKALAKALGADHAHDAARMLRLPGTYNRKDTPVLVQIESTDPDRAYNPAQIEDALAMVAVEPALDDTGTKLEVEIGDEVTPRLQALLIKRRRIASLFNGEGKPEFDPRGGRLDKTSSGYDFSLCLALIRQGVTEPDELATALHHRPDGGARDKGRDYIARTVQNALELADAADVELATAALNFGVDETVIYKTDPARYRMEIDGTPLILTSAELADKRKFSLKFLNALHYAPTLPENSKAWLAVINRWLGDATEIEMPPEASEENALRAAIGQVIRDLPVGTTADDAERQMGLDLGDGVIGFKADAVLDRIREKWPKVERSDVCRILQELGYVSKPTRVNSEHVRLWRLVTA